MEKLTLWILLMGVITFGVRYSFFARSLPIKLNRHAKQILAFTGPCILTAMWTPITFSSAISSISFVDPYLIGGIFTVILSLFVRQTILVILLSMAFFYSLKYFF